MQFIQTRGNDGKRDEKVNFSQALLDPSASYKGLYVPEYLPKIDDDFLNEIAILSYKDTCKKVLALFEIDIDDAVIDEAVNLYDKFDDKNNPVPLTQVKQDLYVSELWHGPTRAFKDLALQPFGSILSHLAKKQEEHYLILAATSGDTGPAALDTFANKENIHVVCMYPDGGTSDIQRLQMVTQDAQNLGVLGIRGNFDDAQNALKNLLSSPTFTQELEKNNIKLSAANSVNFGRIIFQIIYHVANYAKLIKDGVITSDDSIYVIVPSGNFGNALGAYYAKKMGVKIEKILIASNDNNILTELLQTGVYDLRHKKLIPTTSPAMDILKSSNVERILYDKFGAARTRVLMDSLEHHNFYTLTADELSALREDFDATYCNDAYAKEAIATYANGGYIMDPHTATCMKAYDELREKDLISVACSTAEWTKFSPTMASAIKNDNETYSDKEAIEVLKAEQELSVPASIEALFDKHIRHDKIINKTDIEKEILKLIVKK